MSSKFSMSARTPRPPHICRAPPGGPAFHDPVFPYQTYQGYVEWHQPGPYIWGTYAAPFNVAPGPMAGRWTGTAQVGDHVFQINMHWPAYDSPLNHQIRHFISGTPFETHDVYNFEPRCRHPFDSDHIQADPPPTNGYLRWHIWA